MSQVSVGDVASIVDQLGGLVAGIGASIAALAGLVAGTGRLGTCARFQRRLERSLETYDLLRKAGVDADVVAGVRKTVELNANRYVIAANEKPLIAYGLVKWLAGVGTVVAVLLIGYFSYVSLALGAGWDAKTDWSAVVLILALLGVSALLDRWAASVRIAQAGRPEVRGENEVRIAVTPENVASSATVSVVCHGKVSVRFSGDDVAGE